MNKIKIYLGQALKAGFFHLLSANIVMQIAGFGMQIVMTHIVSKETIGRITVLQNFMSPLMLVAGLGINSAILKYCSENISDEERQKIFINGLKLNIISASVMTVLVYAATYFSVFSNSDNVVNVVMRLYCLQIPILVFNNIGMVYLQAQKKIQLMSKMLVIIKCFVIIATLAASYFFELNGYVAGVVISNFLGLIIYAKLFSDEMKILIKTKTDKKYLGKIFDYGKYAFLANVLIQLINSMDVLMANYLSINSETIAVYGIARLLTSGLIMLPSTYNQIMVPQISSHSGDLVKVLELFKLYRIRMVGIAAVIFAASYTIIPFFVPLVFGEGYSGAIQYFKVLVIGLVIWSFYSPVGNTLMSVGKVKLNFISNAVVLVINIVLNVIMISEFGMMGAAYATVIANAAGIFVNQFMFNKVFGKKNII